MQSLIRFLFIALVFLPVVSARADDVKDTEVYARLKKKLDAVRAIDTHSHLRGPGRTNDIMRFGRNPKEPAGCALKNLWRSTYFCWGHSLALWPADDRFDTWWSAAKADFDNSRARSAYRAILPVFSDLYGVDFESLDVRRAKALNERMTKNIDNPDWAKEVLCHRANTEVMVVDAYWRPLAVLEHYPFTVSVCNVMEYIDGFHPSEFKFKAGNLYRYAAKNKLPVESLDDYIAVIDHVLAEAKKAGVVGLKSPNAYRRTLKYDRVPKHRAEKAFGKPRKELTPAQIKDFEDYVFWKIAELAAKHDLPFQIHTGHARIQGSNPMNLVDLIQGNPRTKFILFHGGFPWVGESGMIALRCPNVWLDSCWMPTLSHTMGRRAFKEWLDMISSNRIMWGSDTCTIEGSYGHTVYARQCLYEALADKVIDKELREEDALRIGQRILRENALEVFPSIRKQIP